MSTPATPSRPLRRVVLTGSESVGKTTLAQRLAAHYRVPWVPEFVRRYAEEKGTALTFADHGPIAHGQAAMEDEARAAACAVGAPMLLHDTDVASTVVYCQHYFARCPSFLEDMARERRADLYLLLDIDVPWVPDGIRDRGDRRAEVHTLFLDTLTRLGAPLTIIRGTWEERYHLSVHAIDHLLST